MRSTYLTNLLLLTVAALLVWIVSQSAPLQSPTISTSVEAAHVEKIEILRPGYPPIELQRSSQWYLQKPTFVRANQTRINLLLNLLQLPIQQQFPVTDITNLAAFGLEQPKLTLRFNQQQFIFGNIEPLSGLRYIMHKGQIYVLQEDISPLLSASAGSFADNRLLDPSRKITRLDLPVLSNEFDGSLSHISLFRENNIWHSEPKTYAQDTLLALLQNWQQAYAMQVVIIPETIPVEHQPTVVIELDDRTQRRFIVAQTHDSLTLTDPELQLHYQFPAAMNEALFSLSE